MTGRRLGPLPDLPNLLYVAVIIEERLLIEAGRLEPLLAEVVGPSLGEYDRELGREDPRQKRQVLGQELLLERDRVGRYHDLLARFRGSEDCRDEVGERLSDAGARLRERG